MHTRFVSLCLVVLSASSAVSAQDPADIIKQYFCEVAGMKNVEDGACAVLCNGLDQIVEVPEAMCMPLMEKGWDYLAEQCNNGTAVATKLAAAEKDPTPSDLIDKLLCKLVKSKEAETAFTTEVCEELVANNTLEQKACDEAFDKLWEAVANKCPPAEQADSASSTIVV